MNTENIIKKEKFELIINIIVGAGLLTAGIIMTALDINLIKNNRAIIGLSFILLAIALSKCINIFFIKKYPKTMSTVIVSENDERLVKERNEAEANSNRVFRWLIYLVFFGYTLMVPADIFESIGWWVVFSLFCLSYLLPCIFLKRINDKSHIKGK